jgi:hypothetical protein
MKFILKLDSLFSESSQVTGRAQPDISGMVGQNAQGNEPSHHVPYLYVHAGAPWKTQKVVREIMSRWYTDKADGLCGNDDCGQMSAWYVFSAMGFYPVTPGQNTYAIGSPLFPRVSIELAHDKTFTVKAEHVSQKNMYIQSAMLNGRPLTTACVTHSEIMNGGELDLVMAEKPNIDWGVDNPRLLALAPDHEVVPMPMIESTGSIFFDSAVVVLHCDDASAQIHYTLDGSEPGVASPLYNDAVTLRAAATLKAVSFRDPAHRSMTTTTTFVRSLYPQATYAIAFATKYNGGGAFALTDGRTGTTNFQTGEWQGFEGADLDVVIDLAATKKVTTVSTGFLQDTRDWIFLPQRVEYYVSQDGKVFTKTSQIENNINARKQGLLVKRFSTSLGGIEARYLKVVARNIGECPPWHPGAHGKAWLFVDEVTIQ